MPELGDCTAGDTGSATVGERRIVGWRDLTIARFRPAVSGSSKLEARHLYSLVRWINCASSQRDVTRSMKKFTRTKHGSLEVSSVLLPTSLELQGFLYCVRSRSRACKTKAHEHWPNDCPYARTCLTTEYPGYDVHRWLEREHREGKRTEPEIRPQRLHDLARIGTVDQPGCGSDTCSGDVKIWMTGQYHPNCKQDYRHGEYDTARCQQGARDF